MFSRIGPFLNRVRERLWVRPLVLCFLSVGGAFLAKVADRMELGGAVPEIDPASIEALLSIVASSMLVVATFSVASMVSAYASASSTATPRSFPLVVADDVSQNALSAFIGAFIFSIVALVALKNGYYERAGNFALFVLTIAVFAWVVVTFVRWVDRIARLGRLGATVDKVEQAAQRALRRRRCSPYLGGLPADTGTPTGRAVYGTKIGYVQYVHVPELQRCAQDQSLRIAVAAIPGTFAAPDIPLAYITEFEADGGNIDTAGIESAFEIGDDRVYEDDPRFGLIALSEIAGRALSPAVNDPGTAIDIIGTLIRLFADWSRPLDEGKAEAARCELVRVPALSVYDMFDDAFTAIARDGAASIEVQLRLQKALCSIASLDDAVLRPPARRHSRLALARAKLALVLPEEFEALDKAAQWSADDS